jgi:hypothetical protein
VGQELFPDNPNMNLKIIQPFSSKMGQTVIIDSFQKLAYSIYEEAL